MFKMLWNEKLYPLGKRIFKEEREELLHKSLPLVYWIVWYIACCVFVSLIFFYNRKGCYDDEFFIASDYYRRIIVTLNVFWPLLFMCLWIKFAKVKTKIIGMLLLLADSTLFVHVLVFSVNEIKWNIITYVVLFATVFPVTMVFGGEDSSLRDALVYFFNEYEDDKRETEIIDEISDEKTLRLLRLEKELSKIEDDHTSDELKNFTNRLQSDFRLLYKVKKFGTGYNKTLATKVRLITAGVGINESKATEYLRSYKEDCIALLITYIVIAQEHLKEYEDFEIYKAAMLVNKYEEMGLLDDAELDGYIDAVTDKIMA